VSGLHAISTRYTLAVAELLQLYLDCDRNFERTANALFAPVEERPRRYAVTYVVA
jgi:hypothetical protein